MNACNPSCERPCTQLFTAGSSAQVLAIHSRNCPGRFGSFLRMRRSPTIGTLLRAEVTRSVIFEITVASDASPADAVADVLASAAGVASFNVRCARQRLSNMIAAVPAATTSKTSSRRCIIDLLCFSNAGGPPAKSFAETDLDMFRKAFEQNALSAIRLAKLVLPGMLERNGDALSTSLLFP